MITLSYNEAHDYVDKNRNAFWDGWDIVVWKRNPNGATNQRGMYRNNQWGIAKRYPVGNDGQWRIK